MSNTTDLIVIAALLLCFISGALKGFLKTLLGPISLALGIAASYLYYQYSGDLIISLVIGLFGPFAIKILLSFLLKIFRKTVKDNDPPSSLSRFAGGGINILWGGIQLVIFLLLLTLIPTKIAWLNKLQNDIHASQSFAAVNAGTRNIVGISGENYVSVVNVLENEDKVKSLQGSREYRELMEDNKIKEILGDQQLVQQMRENKIFEVIKDPRIQSIMHDKDLLKKFFALNQKMQQTSEN